MNDFGDVKNLVQILRFGENILVSLDRRKGDTFSTKKSRRKP